jgi:hypothetical protein
LIELFGTQAPARLPRRTLFFLAFCLLVGIRINYSS